MLKTTELFINELKERDLKYRDIRTLQDGDDLVEVGFNLDSTRIRIMIFFDASEKSVALRCFEVTRVTEEQYPNALLSCNELNNKMRWVKFCIGQEMNVHAEADALIDETTAAKVTMELMMRMASIVDEGVPDDQQGYLGLGHRYLRNGVVSRAAAAALRYRQAAGMKREREA